MRDDFLVPQSSGKDFPVAYDVHYFRMIEILSAITYSYNRKFLFHVMAYYIFLTFGV